MTTKTAKPIEQQSLMDENLGSATTSDYQISIAERLTEQGNEAAESDRRKSAEIGKQDRTRL